MAWAHGTTGSAQNCGLSQIIDTTRALNQYFLLDVIPTQQDNAFLPVTERIGDTGESLSALAKGVSIQFDPGYVDTANTRCLDSVGNCLELALPR